MKPYVFLNGDQHINNLHQAIHLNWNNPSISFLNQYTVGISARDFSAPGEGISKRLQFLSAQTSPQIINKTKSYLLLWNQKHAGTKPSVVEIWSVGLWEEILKYRFPPKQRPLVLTMREICMMFPDQLTTIAHLKDLRLSAKLLGIKSIHIHPLLLQGQSREIIDDFLLRYKNLYNHLTRFEKAAIAWWIPKAAYSIHEGK